MPPDRAVNMEDLSSIIGFEALYQSMLKCRIGVGWKDSVASYVLNTLERTFILSKDLQSGTYTPRPVVRFKVTSPKPRDIASVSFRDRVYQRSMNDNVVYPVMTKSFIYDNWAYQKGKGTDAARVRLKSFMRKHYIKHGTDGYVAQFDISGYYPHMSHAITEALFRKKLDKSVADMVCDVFRSQYDGDRGYNPGSQLVQIAGISFLDALDHKIKELLHARLYLRYMDDFIIIHSDKRYLEECMDFIEFDLESVGMTLNAKKTRIYPLREGVGFLGFDFRLTETGKVVMTLKTDNVKRERRKLRRLVAKSRRGFLPKEKVDESYAAWKNHAGKGNTFKLIQRMDRFYEGLWNAGNQQGERS